MGNQYRIDGLRFKLQFGKKLWKTHPNMEMVNTSIGQLRILDTKEGKESLIIIPDGPNIIEHYFGLINNLQKQYRIVLFDLYGFGFSTHQGTYDYSFQKTNELLLELLDYLNIQQANLVFPCANGFYGEMNKWSKRIVPSFLKKPYLSQLLMPFMEKKFANKWYDYALPKGVDRKPYQKIAVEGVKNGGNFCLCSLTQGLANQENKNLEIDPSIPTTLIYGENDFTHKTTNFESIRKYHEKIDIIKFEQCGHFPDLEKQDQFVQIIKEKIKM